ncbi:MAG: hypothetical protein IJA75_06020 [Oscillospiraceae bacterium]|nr:hypothetical protein [Oscillospiraceae bacterium]
MTVPAIAAGRFAVSCLLGAVLGGIYGFLRPVRRRHTVFCDSLFLLCCAGVMVYLGFGVCGGDLRLGCIGGLLLGGAAWEGTAGRLLRPVYGAFWAVGRKILDILLYPGKKILKITKNVFASWKKWVTIEWNNRRHHRRMSGGGGNGKGKGSVRKRKGDPASQFPDIEDRGDRAYRVFYGRPDCPDLGSGQHSEPD